MSSNCIYFDIPKVTHRCNVEETYEAQTQQQQHAFWLTKPCQYCSWCAFIMKYAYNVLHVLAYEEIQRSNRSLRHDPSPFLHMQPQNACGFTGLGHEPSLRASCGVGPAHVCSTAYAAPCSNQPVVRLFHTTSLLPHLRRCVHNSNAILGPREWSTAVKLINILHKAGRGKCIEDVYKYTPLPRYKTCSWGIQSLLHFLHT